VKVQSPYPSEEHSGWDNFLRRFGVPWYYAAFLTLGLVFIGTLFWIHEGAHLAATVRVRRPLDFQVYRDAALNMLHHGKTYVHRFTWVHLPFTYPPIALFAFSGLTFFSVTTSMVLWWLLSALALVAVVDIAIGSVFSLPRSVRFATAFAASGVMCVCLEPTQSSMDFGQINFLLMFLIVYDILRVRKTGRGFLVGIASAIKLTPLTYIFYFAAQRSWRSTSWAIVTFFGAGILGFIFLPSDSVTYWLRQAFSPAQKGNVSGAANQSWLSLIQHMTGNNQLLTVSIWILASVLTLCAGFFVARVCIANGRLLEGLFALALTELLISPISWTHHWSWIVLAPILIVAQWRKDVWTCAAMLLLLLVSFDPPYEWHPWKWYNVGFVRGLEGYSLLLTGALVLATMLVSQWKFAKWTLSREPLVVLPLTSDR
jgi:alpha-1,2-mannosyltransferase